MSIKALLEHHKVINAMYNSVEHKYKKGDTVYGSNNGQKYQIVEQAGASKAGELEYCVQKEDGNLTYIGETFLKASPFPEGGCAQFSPKTQNCDCGAEVTHGKDIPAWMHYYEDCPKFKKETL